MIRSFQKATCHKYQLGCIRKLSISSIEKYTNEQITLKFDNGNSIAYNTVFLRDACQHPLSVDPYSKQKSFSTPQIAQNLHLDGAPQILVDKITKEPFLQVQWLENGAGHTSIYPSSFLLRYTDRDSIRKTKFFDSEQVYWNKSNIDLLNQDYVDFHEYLDGSAFPTVVQNLNKYGICFVNNIPEPTLTSMNEENSSEWPVADLAKMFGYIKRTFYGTLFDVRNEKEAKNIANTSTFLPLHMDLLYYESPPGLQLLHFIKNSTLGGDNVFADSFAAAYQLKKEDPEAYNALKELPINYHYDNANESYYFSRPLIVEASAVSHPNGGPIIDHINYSPPFQGPFELTTGFKGDQNLMQAFLRGFKRFEDLVNDPQNQFQVKMPEGTCVVFDNRRVLHSRLEFSDENGGDRWLMGCYVDGVSYRSRLRVQNNLWTMTKISILQLISNHNPHNLQQVGKELGIL